MNADKVTTQVDVSLESCLPVLVEHCVNLRSIERMRRNCCYGPSPVFDTNTNASY